jgi:hypothetical protein
MLQGVAAQKLEGQSTKSAVVAAFLENEAVQNRPF